MGGLVCGGPLGAEGSPGNPEVPWGGYAPWGFAPPVPSPISPRSLEESFWSRLWTNDAA